MKIKSYLYDQPFCLESGGYLPQLELAYSTYGSLNANKSNVIWVAHALTANADPSEWWKGLVGDSKFFNPKEHFVVCVNVLGSCYGSTGPLSINPITGKPYYHKFPKITIRDIVKSFQLLCNHLGIEKIHTLIGGSLGGQQAMEWAIAEPELFEHLVLIATNAKHSPWGIAFNESQRMAIEADHTWKNDDEKAGEKGLKVARSMALLSYRNYQTYARTQQDDNDSCENYKASSYQNYQGEKLTKRFNAFSYWQLSKTMDSHNVGRYRGGIENALRSIRAKTLVLAISSDLLFPVSESELLANNIPNAVFEIINSLYGHDGFLIETALLAETLENFYLNTANKVINKRIVINE